MNRLIAGPARDALILTGDAGLVDAADRLEQAVPGGARARAAHELFAALAQRAPRLVPVILESLLKADVPTRARALFTAMALRAVPKDSQVAVVALVALARLHPDRPVSDAEAPIYLDLVAAAWMTQRADLARALAMVYRGKVPCRDGGIAANIIAGARLSRFETQFALWRVGGFLKSAERGRAADRARTLYATRYPYFRDMSVPDPRGRVLLLNLRPFLAAETLAGVHNHSNFPQSYKALPRERPLAIDVLLLEHLDFDKIKDSIAPPDVIVSNFGNAELLETPGLADLITTIADHFGVRLINPPHLTRQTTRAANWERIGEGARTVFPKTIRVPSGDEPAARRQIVTDAMPLPLILRSTTGHMGNEMHLAADEATLDAALGALSTVDAYAIAYHEFQSADGFWRKYRAYLVEGEMVGVHVMTAAHWNVHRTALRELDKARPELGLYALSEAFGTDPLAHVPAAIWEELRTLLKATGLDAVGVDFALMADGRALIFEMNSAMRVTGGEVVALDALGRMMERACDDAIAARATVRPKPGGRRAKTAPVTG